MKDRSQRDQRKKPQTKTLAKKGLKRKEEGGIGVLKTRLGSYWGEK